MGARMEKSNRRIALIGFAILMVGLGISDSLRGIFSGIFQTHFALTAKGLSTIIAVSYAGNLCFLLAGGRIMDKIDRKKAFWDFSQYGCVQCWYSCLQITIMHCWWECSWQWELLRC